MSDYRARPNIIKARAITEIRPCQHGGVLDLIQQSGLMLVLDGGDEPYHAVRAMVALFTPSVGDYLVQEPDFEFLCPRVVFERNFQLADELNPEPIAEVKTEPETFNKPVGEAAPEPTVESDVESVADARQQIAEAFTRAAI